MGYRDTYKKNRPGTMVYLTGYVLKSSTAVNKYPCYTYGTKVVLYDGNYECYQCVFCKQWFLWEDITIDHIIPKRDGGTDDLSNLQCACRSCNSSKRDRLGGRDLTVGIINTIVSGNTGDMLKSVAKQKVKDALGIKYKRK